MFEGEQVLQKVFDWVRGDFSQPEEWPICPVHHEPMELFRTVGTPTRFTDQESVQYTLLYRCPVDLCDEAQERVRLRSQIPVPEENPKRPSWAKRDS